MTVALTAREEDGGGHPGVVEHERGIAPHELRRHGEGQAGHHDHEGCGDMVRERHPPERREDRREHRSQRRAQQGGDRARDDGEHEHQAAVRGADGGERRSPDPGDHGARPLREEGQREEEERPDDRAGQQRLPRLQQLVQGTEQTEREQATQQHRARPRGVSRGGVPQHAGAHAEEQREDREEPLLDEQLLEHGGERRGATCPGHAHPEQRPVGQEGDPPPGGAPRPPAGGGVHARLRP
ncbi:hypothetical protein OLY84_13190 [Brachybacterium squillarum]|nr:hypothetical protein [Brachybacterium squillarum]MCW1806236.1 hypothetical protein [Brachybacterium squillarum]